MPSVDPAAADGAGAAGAGTATLIVSELSGVDGGDTFGAETGRAADADGPLADVGESFILIVSAPRIGGGADAPAEPGPGIFIVFLKRSTSLSDVGSEEPVSVLFVFSSAIRCLSPKCLNDL